MKHACLAIAAGLALLACTPEPDEAPTNSAELGMTEPAPAPTQDATPSPATDPAAAPPATDPSGDTCNMAQYASLIGQPATDPSVPPASSTVRHIRPDTQVTMDFQATRLNIDINDQGVITGLRCG